MYYDATEEQLAQWREKRLNTRPLMRMETWKPHVELRRRYAGLVCVCLKDTLTVELHYFTNTEIKNKWFKICEELGIIKWCYFSDLDIAIRPNFKEKDVKPNEHPRDEEREIRFLQRRLFPKKG